MDVMLPSWKRNVAKLVTNVCNIPNNAQFTYAQNGLFTLGKCIDLLPGTCLHMKNVLTCKNRCVSELCKDTCNCKSTTNNSRIESEPGVGLPAFGMSWNSFMGSIFLFSQFWKQIAKFMYNQFFQIQFCSFSKIKLFLESNPNSVNNWLWSFCTKI